MGSWQFWAKGRPGHDGPLIHLKVLQVRCETHGMRQQGFTRETMLYRLNYINNVSRYLMWNRENSTSVFCMRFGRPGMANSFVDLLKTDHIGKRRTVVFTRELGRTYYTSLSKGEPGRNKSRGDAWLAR